MLDVIPFYRTSREITMFRRLPGITVMNQNTSNPNLPTPFINSDFFYSSHYGAAHPVQWLWYMLENMGFKFGWSKRTISSPKHRDQLQHPLWLQINENKSFSSSTYGTLFYLYPIPLYISLMMSHPSWSYKGTFYTLPTSYMHTTWTIYFICIDPITLTLWTVPITNINI